MVSTQFAFWHRVFQFHILKCGFISFKASALHFIYLIFGCTGSLLLCLGFLQLQRAGPTLQLWHVGCYCSGISCFRAQALGTQVSVVPAHSLSSCGTQTPFLHSVWNLPRPGIKLMPLNWQMDFYLLYPQGNPRIKFLF